MRLLAINLQDRFAIREDDSCVPITNLFDTSGEEVSDVEEAFTFVAGDERGWFSHRLDDFNPATLN